MTSQALTALVVLVGLQLLVLRASQHAVPSLYFTTSSLFDRRADVSGRAVLFRLSVPLVAGAGAALLVPQQDVAVATASGALCWFLIIWPIIWNPRLVSHGFHLPFVAMLGTFWVAYAAIPLSGVAIVNVVQDVAAGRAPEWQEQYVWGVITGLTFAGVAKLASGFAARRLSFADDPQPDVEPEERYEEYYDSEPRAVIRYLPALALIATSIGLAVRAMGKRRGADR